MATVISSQPAPSYRYQGSGPGTSNVTLKMVSDSGPRGGMMNNMARPPPRMTNLQQTGMYQATDLMLMGDGPGRRLRKNVANVRRHVDYVSTVLNHAEARLWQYGDRRRHRILQQPDELYQNTALPASCTPEVPVDCVLTKFVRAAMNKVKCPVYSLCWTPEGKRLITGASTGEFTLWNGTAFNFETILQAHDGAIRAMTWSHNEQWLVSADHDGFVKYWQPNMNNVHMYQAHKDEPIRGVSFAPTDVKFVTASDDGSSRVWDFARCKEERVLRGHGSEVRCVDWHPTKGLIVTGARDSQQPVKLWDPKSGQCLSTLQDHKSSVMAVQWNKNGNWLLTAGRDHLVKLYDIRIMKEIRTFRGHKKEVTSVAWNPVHEGLFVSGCGDGSLAYWLVDSEKEVGLLEHAHDQAIWAMNWHPMGHILATGSNDNNTKFWARNRPGDTQEDIFGLASFSTNMVGALDKEREPKLPVLRDDDANAPTMIPGMGLDEDVYEKMNRDISNMGTATSTATLLLMPEDVNASRQNASNVGAKRTLIKQPPPKKAQREFERTWNVSKPGAVMDEAMHEEEEVYRRPKQSLLGKAPAAASMLSQARVPPPQVAPRVQEQSGVSNGAAGGGDSWKTGPPPHVNQQQPHDSMHAKPHGALPPPHGPPRGPPPGQPPSMPPATRPNMPPVRPPGAPPPGFGATTALQNQAAAMTLLAGQQAAAIGASFPLAGFPPGMPPLFGPGGLPMPPPTGMLPPPALAGHMAAAMAAQKAAQQAANAQQQHKMPPMPPPQKNSGGGGGDVDYRMSGDVDLRGGGGETSQPPPKAMIDPRMRQRPPPPQQQDNDPRTRRSQGVQQPPPQQQQEAPKAKSGGWMPQMNNFQQQQQQQQSQQNDDYGSSMNEDYGNDEGDYGNEQSYGRGGNDGYSNGGNSGGGGGGYGQYGGGGRQQGGYNNQQHHHQQQGGGGYGGNRGYRNQQQQGGYGNDDGGYQQKEYGQSGRNGGGPQRGGPRGRGRGRGRPY